MSRYIDADKLKRSIEAQCRVLRAIGIDELTEMTGVLSAGFFQEIENAPTEDVVKVVRCKDCRFHENEQIGMVYCPAVVGGWVEDNWFCKGGERRDD